MFATVMVILLEREGERRASGALDLGQALPGAPAIALAAPHETVDIPSLVDRPTVIDVWQSWCEPCKQSLLPLERFADSVGPDRLRVVYLTMNAVDDTARITEFLAQSGVHHPPPVYSILQSSAEVLYLMHGAPFTMIIDRNRRLRWREHGPIFTTAGLVQSGSKTLDTLKAILAADRPGKAE
ncbi:MAG: TlpA disulfide reductase family protein [Gemmatimonadota bacterium]